MPCISVNVRENRRGNHKWTIQKLWQHSTQDTERTHPPKITKQKNMTYWVKWAKNKKGHIYSGFFTFSKTITARHFWVR